MKRGQRLCDVSRDVTGATGAGIMLMSDDIPRGSVCSTDAVSALIEDVQYELGEGPCIDAHRHGQPVLEPDLANPMQPRWLGFGPPVLAAGARAVYGFPLRVGSVRLGALNLYRDRAAHLNDDQHADALVMADVAAEAVLAFQAGAPPHMVAAELEEAADFRYVVHQASGMVASQLGSSITQAMIRLRAHAFANDRRLNDVAEDVLAGRLRFDGADGEIHPDE